MSCSPEPVLASYMGAMGPSLNPASFLSNQWGSPQLGYERETRCWCSEFSKQIKFVQKPLDEGCG